MGRLGNGRQWSSWVSRDELACIIEYILHTEALEGPLNPTSPTPVRNVEFTSIQSLILGRKPGFPIPAFLLRLMIGEMDVVFQLNGTFMQAVGTSDSKS